MRAAGVKMRLAAVAALEFMKTQHTPGPWSVGPENCGSGRNVYHFRDYIAHTVGYNAKPGSNQRTLTEQESEANAQLIAAAPELLEALQECLRGVATPLSNHPWAVKQRKAHTQARAAIAKATGESPGSHSEIAPG